MIDQIFKMREGAYAENTLRAYASDLRLFTAFTAPNEPLLPASPELIADYIAALAEQRKSYATIKRHVATLSAMHRFGDFEDPTKAIVVKLALRRAGRQLGSAQRQVAPINRPLLDRMLATCEDSLIGARDRALLLLAYETARRRSELVAFSVEHLVEDKGRITGIWLRKSKTDQFGMGKRLALSETAAQAIGAWVRLAKLENGPLLRAVRRNKIEDSLSAGQVARIFKTRAKKAGAGRGRADRISGHSLRVGKAQDMLSEGASLPQIMVSGGWRKPATAIRYCENTQLNPEQNTQLR